MTESTRSFQPLDARLAGDPVDETLFEGTPVHLAVPLRRWISQVLTVDARINNSALARRVALRLKVEVPDNWSYDDAIMDFYGKRLHIVVDAILQLNQPGDRMTFDDITDLADILEHGSSAYRLDEDWGRLVSRVDPTVEEAFRVTLSNAGDEPAKHLRNAWRKAYGLDPDPTAAYREAVRAVEAAACPVVLPNNDKATLGMVIAHLRDAPHKWETVLVHKDGTPGDPEPIRALMDRLWTGQVSRHGGGKNSRDQDRAEAEAAVHTATFLVQALTSKVLRPVPGDT